MYTGADPRTGTPRQISRTFGDTWREADTALTNFLTEVVKGQVPVGASATRPEYLGQWLDHITPTRSTTTVRGYRFKIKRISARLGSIRLDRLTAQHLDRAYRHWLDEGFHPSSVHHLHRVLSAALRQAVKWGLAGEAVTQRATPLPDGRSTFRSRRPKRSRVSFRWQNAGGSRCSPRPLPSPLRRSELAGLPWHDLDLDRGRLHVHRAIKSGVNGGWAAGPPKTHQNRVVPRRLHRGRAPGAPGPRRAGGRAGGRPSERMFGTSCRPAFKRARPAVSRQG